MPVAKKTTRKNSLQSQELSNLRQWFMTQITILTKYYLVILGDKNEKDYVTTFLRLSEAFAKTHPNNLQKQLSKLITDRKNLIKKLKQTTLIRHPIDNRYVVLTFPNETVRREAQELLQLTGATTTARGNSFTISIKALKKFRKFKPESRLTTLDQAHKTMRRSKTHSKSTSSSSPKPVAKVEVPRKVQTQSQKQDIQSEHPKQNILKTKENFLQEINVALGKGLEDKNGQIKEWNTLGIGFLGFGKKIPRTIEKISNELEQFVNLRQKKNDHIEKTFAAVKKILEERTPNPYQSCLFFKNRRAIEVQKFYEEQQKAANDIENPTPRPTLTN